MNRIVDKDKDNWYIMEIDLPVDEINISHDIGFCSVVGIYIENVWFDIGDNYIDKAGYFDPHGDFICKEPGYKNVFFPVSILFLRKKYGSIETRSVTKSKWDNNENKIKTSRETYEENNEVVDQYATLDQPILIKYKTGPDTTEKIQSNLSGSIEGNIIHIYSSNKKISKVRIKIKKDILQGI